MMRPGPEPHNPPAPCAPIEEAAPVEAITHDRAAALFHDAITA